MGSGFQVARPLKILAVEGDGECGQPGELGRGGEVTKSCAYLRSRKKARKMVYLEEGGAERWWVSNENGHRDH